MNINFDKINEIYGREMVLLIKDNIDNVVHNINYLKKIGFNDIEDIFERYVPIFLYTEKELKNKFNNLIKSLGIEYVELIENNLGILEELL